MPLPFVMFRLLNASRYDSFALNPRSCRMQLRNLRRGPRPATWGVRSNHSRRFVAARGMYSAHLPLFSWHKYCNRHDGAGEVVITCCRLQRKQNPIPLRNAATLGFVRSASVCVFFQRICLDLDLGVILRCRFLMGELNLTSRPSVFNISAARMKST